MSGQEQQIQRPALSPSQQSIYSRLDSYVQRENVHLTSFWHTNHVCITIDQFDEMLSAIGFFIQQSQKDILKRDSVEFISLESIINGVEYWKKEVGSISDFLTLLSKRPEATQQQVIAYQNKTRIKSNSERPWNHNGFTNNHTYLAEHKKKGLKNNFQLTETMTRAKNQSDYENTIKVGQLNDICKKLKNNLSYTINSTTTGFEIYQKNGKNGQEKKITKRQFERKYQGYKLAIINMVDEIQGTLEDDLRKVLVEVMCTSDQLEKQIKLIESKRIGH